MRGLAAFAFVLLLLACGAVEPPEVTSELEPATTGVAIQRRLPASVVTGIQSVTPTGNGCQGGTFTADVSPDGQAFEVVFSSFRAEVTPGKKQDKASCQLHIDLAIPRGWSYAVTDVGYQGFFLLSGPGVHARHASRIAFPGNVGEKAVDGEVEGPLVGPYTFTTSANPADLAWSKCGKADKLRLASTIIVENDPARAGSGIVTTSSVDGTLRLVLGLTWRPC